MHETTPNSVECHYSRISFVVFHCNVKGTIKDESRPRAQKRVTALHLLHECIDMCLRPFAKKTYGGHAFQIKSGSCFLFLFALIYYVADIFKSKTLLGIKMRGQTKYPRHKCSVITQKL